MNQTLKSSSGRFSEFWSSCLLLYCGTNGTAATYAPDISPLAIGARCKR
nr:hypothetical protein [Vibrio neptunius]